MTANLPIPRRRRVVFREGSAVVADGLAAALGLPHAAARVLAARGFSEAEAARRHLAPSAADLHDPFGMTGLAEAVERLGATARRGGRIVVFGDYDCDGVTAVAILTTVLGKLGADARAFLPHRLKDGYGLKPASLVKAIEEHAPEGLVTVDCGITAVESVSLATERGVYVVVTDHHIPPRALPSGGVLVNPKLPGCAYPFKELCGAGLAWKLAEALLLADGARVGVVGEAFEAWRASLVKLVALATIADMVPLVGENRVLAAWGLAGLAEPRAPGLVELLRKAAVGAGRAPSARQVAFRVAPRLNAAGRVDHAARALELLTTADPARARLLAEELEASNTERRALQERVVAAVLERVAATFDAGSDAIVVEAGTPEEGWHRGVLGIAASRVAAEVRRPVLLLSREEDRLGGSGRTWGRTPLFARLEPVARRHAREFGGHAAALGLTLPAERYDAFRDEARAAFAASRDDDEWVEELPVDTALAPEEATGELAAALESFEPHGVENPRPLFHLRDLRWDGRGRPVGPRGLRVTFAFGANGTSRRLDAVGWDLAGLPSELREGVFDVTANLAVDSYTGRPTLTVLHLARSGEGA